MCIKHKLHRLYVQKLEMLQLVCFIFFFLVEWWKKHAFFEKEKRGFE